MAGNATFVRCDLETALCPRTVLCKRQDTRVTFSSEVEARGRRRTRAPLTTRAVCTGAGVRVSANGGLRESALDAQRRSATHSLPHYRAGMVRVIPWLSSEASSSLTPLPAPCKHVDIAQAVFCFHIS